MTEPPQYGVYLYDPHSIDPTKPCRIFTEDGATEDVCNQIATDMKTRHESDAGYAVMVLPTEPLSAASAA